MKESSPGSQYFERSQVWLGGRMYDIYGDYTLVWWIGVGVGAFSALVHLPVRERRSEPQGLPA